MHETRKQNKKRKEFDRSEKKESTVDWCREWVEWYAMTLKVTGTE